MLTDIIELSQGGTVITFGHDGKPEEPVRHATQSRDNNIEYLLQFFARISATRVKQTALLRLLPPNLWVFRLLPATCL